MTAFDLTPAHLSSTRNGARAPGAGPCFPASLILCLATLGLGACAPRGDASPEPDPPFTRLASGWEHCAEPGRPAPTAGNLWLQTTAAATYCLDPLSADGPHELIDNKVKIHLGADDVFLPLDDGEHEVFLSVCGQARFAEIEDVRAVGPAKWTVTRTTVLGQTTIDGVLRQPLDDGRNFEIKFRGPETVMAGYQDDAPGGILLDGSARSASVTPQITMRLCEDVSCEGDFERRMTSCPSLARETFDRATMTFEGGELKLVSRFNPEAEVFEGSLLTAEGNLDGTAFEVKPPVDQAYWHLAQFPAYGNLVRAAAVRFDSEINGVCGLWIRNYLPIAGFTYRIQSIRCEDDLTRRLNPISSRYEADISAP